MAFLIAGMKTSGDDADLQNVMVAAFFGMVLSLALLFEPERPPG